MSPENDRAPGGNQAQRANKNSDVIKDTANPRRSQRATPLVYAEVREVAGRQRNRLEMFVHCACGALHSHRAPVDFLAGRRSAPCGARYTVVAGIVREVAA